jgi:glycogen(starch) synthase
MVAGGRETPPRLLLVGDYPPPWGGIAVHVRALLDLALREGFDARVLDVGGARRERRFPRVIPAAGGVSFAAALLAAARAGAVVHAHVSGNNGKAWLVALAAGRARRPGGPGTLLTVHSGLVPAYLAARASRRRLARAACTGYTRVLAVNGAIAGALEVAGVPGEKLAVMPAAVPARADFATANGRVRDAGRRPMANGFEGASVGIHEAGAGVSGPAVLVGETVPGVSGGSVGTREAAFGVSGASVCARDAAAGVSGPSVGVREAAAGVLRAPAFALAASAGVSGSAARVGPSASAPAAPTVAVAARRRHRPLLVAALAPGGQYGEDVLLAALPRLVSVFPEAGLLAFGPGADEPWAARRAGAGLRGRVTGLGELDHPAALATLALADVFVRPTRADGDSLSVREALGLGIRVVASDVGHRPAGVVRFRAGDAADLAAQVREALAAPPPRGEALDVSNSILGLWRSVLPGAPRPRARARGEA